MSEGLHKSNSNPTRSEGWYKLNSRIRHSEIQFNFKEHCLFCGQPAKYENKKRICEVFPVRTKNFQSEIIRTCEKRKDDWSNLVAGRIAFAQDLHAADAIYHQICSVNFRTLKKLPQQFSATVDKSSNAIGRPEEADRQEAFLRTMVFFEDNDDEQITIVDLVMKTEQLLQQSESDSYSVTYMKKKLLDRYGDQIIVTEIN